MNFDHLFDQHQDNLEDFWGRRGAEPQFSREFHIFGREVRLSSNDAGALTAVDHSLSLYSTTNAVDLPPFNIQFLVQSAHLPPGPAPDDLMDYAWYSGQGDWLMIQLGDWGHAFIDLGQGKATAVLSPELAGRPDLVSRCLLNTILLNFCLGNGYGMLHASCLYRDGRALLLIAPHNSGKSTTALRMVMLGYPLLTDSMVHISPHSQELSLMGFPVGRLKLREDVAVQFPQLQPYLSPEPVRDELKYSFDVRDFNPELVMETAVSPDRIDLCLLTRNDTPTTSLAPASETAVWDAIMANSLYFDSIEIWRKNLAQIHRCLDNARCHHLSIGTDTDLLIGVVERLWE